MSDKYDGEVIINTRLDTDNIDKDVKGLDKTLKNNDKQGKLNIASMAKLGAGIAAVGVAAKAASAVISDLTEEYKSQRQAQIQLETAAKNNPYFNDSNVQRLKDFAGAFNDLAGIDDDVLLPLMGQLIASGRTEQQIIDIINASVDASASGRITLESAVSSLNRSLDGELGRLSMLLPATKNLTEEQLKNGAAIDAIATGFKDVAKNTTEATGTSIQLKNSLGDLKAAIGRNFEQSLAPVRNFFREIVDGWTEAITKRQEYEDANKRADAGNATSNDLQIIAESISPELERATEAYNVAVSALQRMEENMQRELEKNTLISRNRANNIAQAIEFQKKDIELLRLSKERAELAHQSVLDEMKALEEEEAARQAAEIAAAEAAAAEAARIKEIEDRKKQATEHIQATRAALDKQLQTLQLIAEATGDTVDQQEVLNAYVNGYVSLITESNGLVTENNQAAKDWLVELNAIAETLPKVSADQTKAIEELKSAREKLNESIDSIMNVEPEKESERMQLLLDQLDKEYEAVINRKELEATEKRRIDDEYLAAREKLSDDIKKVAEEEAAAEVQSKRQAAADMAAIISNFANQYAQITSTIAALAKDNITTEAEIQKLEAKKQFDEGIISQEEYEKKKQDIDKKAAKEEYKIKMWEWSASILTAAANIAQGITSALAQGPIGIITASLVGAAGAAQIATIISKKPVPPKFGGGGIIDGRREWGDTQNIIATPKEMVLNDYQQSGLWNFLKNGSRGIGSEMKVEIHNTASNVVKAQPQMTERGMKIMIEQVVGDSIRSGRQNSNLRSADASQYGTAYTN